MSRAIVTAASGQVSVSCANNSLSAKGVPDDLVTVDVRDCEDEPFSLKRLLNHSVRHDDGLRAVRVNVPLDNHVPHAQPDDKLLLHLLADSDRPPLEPLLCSNPADLDI